MDGEPGRSIDEPPTRYSTFFSGNSATLTYRLVSRYRRVASCTCAAVSLLYQAGRSNSVPNSAASPDWYFGSDLGQQVAVLLDVGLEVAQEPPRASVTCFSVGPFALKCSISAKTRFNELVGALGSAAEVDRDRVLLAGILGIRRRPSRCRCRRDPRAASRAAASAGSTRWREWPRAAPGRTRTGPVKTTRGGSSARSPSRHAFRRRSRRADADVLPGLLAAMERRQRRRGTARRAASSSRGRSCRRRRT